MGARLAQDAVHQPCQNTKMQIHMHTTKLKQRSTTNNKTNAQEQHDAPPRTRPAHKQTRNINPHVPPMHELAFSNTITIAQAPTSNAQINHTTLQPAKTIPKTAKQPNAICTYTLQGQCSSQSVHARPNIHRIVSACTSITM